MGGQAGDGAHKKEVGEGSEREYDLSKYGANETVNSCLILLTTFEV